MKKGFVLLLTLFLVLYGKEGYELLQEHSDVTMVENGKLSDIAEKVVAIPLQKANGKRLQKPLKVKKDGEELFLVCNETLYHYDIKGNFICHITDPSGMEVAEYLLDSANSRIIVMGNGDDVHYYSYAGELLDARKFPQEETDVRLLSVGLHNNRIWVTKEVVKEIDGASPALIRREIVEYDTSFYKINSYPLDYRDMHSSGLLADAQLSVNEDTGQLYLFSPPCEPEELLMDTLQIRQKQTLGRLWARVNGVPVSPVRFGSRFWLSAYKNDTEEQPGYLYCYDWRTNRYWKTHEGLKDNYYHTGHVKDLQAMDAYNHSYCFVRSGKEIRKSFPRQYREEQPVIFIVSLKA